MKKIILLNLFLILIIQSSAQSNTVSVTEIYNNNYWVLSHRMITSYNNNINEFLYQKWDPNSNNWINIEKTEYEYENEKIISRKWAKWNEIENKFVYTQKLIFYYSIEGLLTEEHNVSVNSLGQENLNSKVEYYYNDSNNIFYTINFSGNNLEAETKTEYIYKNEKDIDQKLIYDLRGSSEFLLNKIGYYYTNDVITSISTYEINLNAWHLIAKESRSFNNQGYLSKVKNYAFIDYKNSLDLTNFQDYFYYSDNKLSLIIGYSNGINGIQPTFRTTFHYDMNLNTENVELKPSFNIYPNPAQNVVFIKGINEATKVQFFDLNGKLIFEKLLIYDDFLDISNLKPAVYTIQIESENQVQHLKFLKQ